MANGYSLFGDILSQAGNAVREIVDRRKAEKDQDEEKARRKALDELARKVQEQNEVDDNARRGMMLDGETPEQGTVRRMTGVAGVPSADERLPRETGVVSGKHYKYSRERDPLAVKVDMQTDRQQSAAEIAADKLAMQQAIAALAATSREKVAAGNNATTARGQDRRIEGINIQQKGATTRKGMPPSGGPRTPPKTDEDIILGLAMKERKESGIMGTKTIPIEESIAKAREALRLSREKPDNFIGPRQPTAGALAPLSGQPDADKKTNDALASAGGDLEKAKSILRSMGYDPDK